MRVLHLVASLNPTAGGVSQAVLTMIKGLSEKGVANEVATIDDPNADYLQHTAFPIHAKGPGKTPWQYAPKLLEWLTLNMQCYNAVIVHGLWQYQTFAAYKAWRNIKANKPKLLVMPHGMLDPYFQRAKGRKLKAIRNWLFWKLVESRLINTASGILFTCETEKILAREPFSPYRPKAEAVVGLGVEKPPAYQEDMRAAFEQKIGISIPTYWLFISRIHEKKGVDLLIEAYLSLKNEITDLPLLVIAGPGLETPFGTAMKALASTDTNIRFSGMLTGNAKWGAFYGCEAFILPSHQENFGIAVVEALACGKPVLISDQVNIWREIQSGGGGMIAKDTSKEIIGLLRDWYNLPVAEKQMMKHQALQVFNESFSEKMATQKLLAVLES